MNRPSFTGMPLGPDDVRHLIAAQGYAELTMYADAREELDRIAAEGRSGPEVLAVRLHVYRGMEKWNAMQAVARILAESDPGNAQWAISDAYATRRAESIEAAKSILLLALQKHPKEPMIRYNLGCYECRQQHLDAAREYLADAFQLEKRLRIIALDDEDLKPLEAEIRSELI